MDTIPGFWSARKKSVDVSVAAGVDENGGEGREIENVCTVCRGLAIAPDSKTLRSSSKAKGKANAWRSERVRRARERESTF